jgi:cytochrome c-type biogenesis protein
MGSLDVSFGLAILAGLASFFSPCVFSLVPAYVGYLSGQSLTQKASDVKKIRWTTLLNGLAFVVGFSFVFISLGIAASALGQFFFQTRDILAKAGGVIMILFGLHMTGAIHIPFLDYDFRAHADVHHGGSLLSSFLMGVLFSAGWSPCVGPTLGLILTLAIERANIGQGILLLGAYSLGMGIPFLAAALGVGWVTQVLRKHSRAMHVAQVVMGVLLIIIGVMLFLGIYQRLISFESLIDFGL